jgi:hypothetical protein
LCLQSLSALGLRASTFRDGFVKNPYMQNDEVLGVPAIGKQPITACCQHRGIQSIRRRYF